PSTINHQPSTINHQQSLICVHLRLSAVSKPFGGFKRRKAFEHGADADNRHERSRPRGGRMEAIMRQDERVVKELGMTGPKQRLEPNGRGGYAPSTVEGMNTRRYHGPLGAALPPPVGGAVLLSKFEETLFLGGRAYEFGCNQYPGVLHPRGFQYLQEFRLD